MAENNVKSLRELCVQFLIDRLLSSGRLRLSDEFWIARHTVPQFSGWQNGNFTALQSLAGLSNPLRHMICQRIAEIQKWTRKHAHLFGREIAERLRKYIVWRDDRQNLVDNTKTAEEILNASDGALTTIQCFKLAAYYWQLPKLQAMWAGFTDMDKISVSLSSDSALPWYWAYRLALRDSLDPQYIQTRVSLATKSLYAAAEHDFHEAVINLWNYEIQPNGSQYDQPGSGPQFYAVRAFGIAVSSHAIDTLYALWSAVDDTRIQDKMLKGVGVLSLSLTDVQFVYACACNDNHADLCQRLLCSASPWQALECLKQTDLCQMVASKQTNMDVIKVLVQHAKRMRIFDQQLAANNFAVVHAAAEADRIQLLDTFLENASAQAVKDKVLEIMAHR